MTYKDLIFSLSFYREEDGIFATTSDGFCMTDEEKHMVKRHLRKFLEHLDMGVEQVNEEDLV